MPHPLRLRRGIVLGLVVAACVATAQSAKRPLTHSDFDTWRSIATPVLSRDGQWLAYSFMPQDADGELVVRKVATGQEHRVPVGAPLPPPLTPSEETTTPEAPPPLRTIRIAFTSDSQFVVATTHPSKTDMSAARKARKKPDEMPKPGLVVLNLANGDAARIADVKSFQVPAKGGAWVAYLKEAKPEEKKADEAKPATKATEPVAEAEAATPNDEDASEDLDDPDDHDQRARSSAASTASSSGSSNGERAFGTELVLRRLADGAERSFASVTDYALARDGGTLLYTVASRTPSANGVYAVTPGENSEPAALVSGRGHYTRLAWDREQTQAVFASDRDAPGAGASARFTLYLWRRGAAEAKAVMSAQTKGFPEAFVISDRASSQFSRDGRKLYVPAAPPPKPSRAAATAASDDERVTADLWHWRDGFVQPMQKVRATQERNRTFRGVLDLESETYTQLAEPTMHTVTLSDDGTRAFGYDDRAYRHRVDFDGRFSDIYVVDPATGARRLALRQLRSESGATLQWSPDGKWACYYQNRQWHLLHSVDGTSVPLTAGLRVAFHNEDFDRPEPPPAYGSAGWTKDSASFVAHDRYDVWQLFVDGRPPKNLTAGHGRAQKIQFRVQRTDPLDPDDDERGIDPTKPLVLRGEQEDTRASGFFRTSFAGSAAPQRLLWGDKNYRYAGRAQDADALLVTASRFDEYPDVHVTDSSFAKLVKATDGGAQLEKFAWGTSEILRFRNADGVALKAALYKPADFDPKKKYPLLVYIYERLSQNVHNFVAPAPGNNVNVSFYTSNGYVVLMPDIVYKVGQPGQSALRCVLPAVDAAVRLGCIDEKAIGIQGHSWGGYHIAYMLTQTDRFRAAEAGAPVGNMTSAYSGIRWGSGLPRQWQYEKSQSRIGQPLQSALPLYVANSPVFHIERVRTPLLILHNDADDAVPWYQGIELFLALRRHEKPAWLFNYNGGLHGLRRRADQKDWSRRMHQFFDHFLKGEPAPAWLENRIPYVERDEEKEKFNAPPLPPKIDPERLTSTQ